MPNLFDEAPDAQTVQRHISAMGDSVYLINKLISEGVHSESIHDTVDRNTRHLQIMLDKDYIQNSGTDLTVFQTAIDNGNAFISQPV